MKHMPAATSTAARRKARARSDGGAVAAGTDTIDLALRILDHLAAAREPVGVSDIARAFDASKATVYRHLQTLARHGYVRQEPATMRYGVGIKLFIMGESLRERFDLLAIAREDMAWLRDECNQPVTLSTVVDDQVVVLEVLQGRAVVNFGTQAGTVLELHASAHGRVALAFGPPGLLDRCLARPLKQLTPETICTRAALERTVAQARSNGWATAPNQVLHGVNGLAAPIFNHVPAYAGAIAIAGSIQYIPAAPSKAQIEPVMEAARRISRKLGWRAK
jgi:DNA-binding IclR family transcriptional regulator